MWKNKKLGFALKIRLLSSGGEERGEVFAFKFLLVTHVQSLLTHCHCY
jgi:LytTr DNA-binding domain-containing protein